MLNHSHPGGNDGGHIEIILQVRHWANQTMMTRKSGGLMASVEQQTFDVDLPRMEFVGGCNMRSSAREGRYVLHQVVQFG